MKKIVCLIIFVISSAMLQSQTVTLEDLINESLLNNYSIKIGKVSEKIADKNVNIGNAGMLPRIDITRSLQYSMTDIYLEFSSDARIGSLDNITRIDNAGLQLGLTLFDGLAMFANYSKLQELRDKSRIELKIMIETMIRELAQNYYGALKQKSNLAILNESLGLTNRRIESIRNRIDYGVGLSLELLRAEVDRNADSSAFLQTQLAYNNLLRALNYLTGANIIRTLEPDTNVSFLQKLELAELREAMFANNSQLMQAIKNKQISEYDRKLVLSQFYPRITINAGYSYARSESDAGFFLVNQSEGLSAGISLQWNIMDGSKHIINAQNSKLLIEIQELNIEMMRANLDMLLNNLYDNYTRRLAIYELEQQNITTARSNFERTLSEYELGRVTSLELREAQLNLIRSNERISNAKYDAKLAETELLILSGTFKIAR